MPRGAIAIVAESLFFSRNDTFFTWRYIYLEMSLFPSIFCTIAVFSLYGKSTSYVLSFRMVFFLPCADGLDFLHQLM